MSIARAVFGDHRDPDRALTDLFGSLDEAVAWGPRRTSRPCSEV